MARETCWRKAESGILFAPVLACKGCAPAAQVLRCILPVAELELKQFGAGQPPETGTWGPWGQRLARKEQPQHHQGDL